MVSRLLPLLLVLIFVLTGCTGQENLSTLLPKGDAAEWQYFMIKYTFYVMLIVVVVVTVLFLYALKFRAKPGDNSIPKQVEGNTKLEILWTVTPFLLILSIAVPLVRTELALAEIPEDAMKVKVTAHQFWWEFEYPDHGIVTSQDLVIPVGEKVSFELTSKDVIHAFWVPALGGKMDTNPDNVNYMWLKADEPGVYQGRCTELCGASHALMDFKVKAVPKEEFEQWVEKMKQPNPEPTDAIAQQGQQIFNQSCVACHAVEGTMKSVGPNLKGFADKSTVAGYLEMKEEDILKWLKNPKEVKPQNTMPSPMQDLKLTEDQLKALSKYLMTLKLE